jgi:hypothetical protein
MAHWAKINEGSIVENVIVTSNDGVDEGESWIAENLEGTWLKTSYNTLKNRHAFGGEAFRKNFAQPGFTYDAELDAFIPPKAEGEDNFVLDTDLGIWVPPVPKPEDGDVFIGYDNYNGQLTEDLKVYYWMPKENAWAMMPYGNKPEGSFEWNALQGQWVEAVPPQYPSEQQEWPSWIQGEDGLWYAPVERPTPSHFWDEAQLNWIALNPATE